MRSQCIRSIDTFPTPALTSLGHPNASSASLCLHKSPYSARLVMSRVDKHGAVVDEELLNRRLGSYAAMSKAHGTGVRAGPALPQATQSRSLQNNPRLIIRTLYDRGA